MKVIYVVVAVVCCTLLFSFFWYSYLQMEDSKKENTFDINIKEKLIFKFDRKDGLYSYDFSWKKFTFVQENQSIIPIEYSWDTSKKIAIKDNSYLYNWGFYFNWKKKFDCDARVCPFYLDKSGQYLILIDKQIYKKLFYKKLLGQNIFKVFDFKTWIYMSIESPMYNWEKINSFEMVWYKD